MSLAESPDRVAPSRSGVRPGRSGIGATLPLAQASTKDRNLLGSCRVQKSRDFGQIQAPLASQGVTLAVRYDRNSP
jgi:hypothetical protein